MGDPGERHVDGYDARDFGADRIVTRDNEYGGTHYTAYSTTGGQVSWDTDRNNHVDGSEHLSDRNCDGREVGVPGDSLIIGKVSHSLFS